MEKIICFENPQTKILAIVHLNPKARLEDESDDDFLARIAKSVVPEGVEWHVKTRQDLHHDGYWRNAWTLDGGIDLQKARDAQRAKIRERRERAFEKLDRETIVALSKGDTAAVAAIDKRKQALRDAPSDHRIDIVTLEELKEAGTQALVAEGF